jgi:ISXO2-like transposase domain
MHTATGHTKQSVADFSAHFRELVADSLDDVDMIIGGSEIEVQIDETKMGKRKYHRGHSVDGVWVLGGVERTPERKIFAVAVPDRSAETLVAVINRYVAEGSTIVTDLWKGYSNISQLNNYHHMTVNHSLTFKDPVTGANTNTIEGTWCGLKAGISFKNRTSGSIESHLWEFIWRRKNQQRLWDAFIDALVEVYYD